MPSTNSPPHSRYALLWSLADRTALQGIQFVISIILARLIAPSEFGLIAMILVFTAMSQQLMEAGLRSALIQKKDLKQEDCSTVLLANILLAISLIIILNLCANSIADFYREPRLAVVLRVVSMGLIFQAPDVVQGSLLSRAMNFRTQGIAAVVAACISGCVGISMAVMGYGVWALVASSILGILSRTCLLWILSDWRPTKKPSYVSLKELLPYSSKVLLLRILETGFNNIFTLLIGRIYSPADVAFYQRAKGLAQIPTGNIEATTGRVFFPLLSSRQSDDIAYEETLAKATRTSAFVIFPAMGLLYLTAESIVILLLGDRWIPVVPILKVLCIVEALRFLHYLNGFALTARGLAGLALKVEFLKRPLMLGMLALTANHGIHAMVIGNAVQTLVAVMVAAVATGTIVNYGLIRQIRDVYKPLLIVFAIGVAVSAVPNLGIDQPVITMIGTSVGFTLCYLVVSHLIGLQAMKECISFASEFKESRNGQ